MSLWSAPLGVQTAIAGLKKTAFRSTLMLAQATGTPTVPYVYDPVNGKLQYIFENYPDKSSTVVEYDTENKNTWSTVIFDSNAAGQLADFTSVNRDGTLYTNYYDTTVSGDPLRQVDFSNADGTWNATFYDTANKQTWSKSIYYYTAASVLTNATLSLRSGSTEYQVYDTAHADALQTDTTYAPGGTASEWVYDTANVNTWSKYLFDSSGTSKLDQTFYYRSGVTEVVDWDAAHGDALQTDTTYGPNGAASQWVYDTADVNTWSKYLYDASGIAKVDQTFYYRSGVQEVLRWDVAHGDALQYDDTYNTNGTVHEVANDTANVNNWSTLITDWYTRGGQVSDQSFYERDGVNNTNFYASNGALTVSVTVGAGGEEAIASYNAGGGSEAEVFDEENRVAYTAYLSTSNSMAIQSPSGYVFLGSSWYNAHTYAASTFQDSAHDTEERFVNSLNQSIGIQDQYGDGTSDVTVFSTSPGIGLSAITSTFGSSGQLKDVIETSTQGTEQNVVTFTAAELLQSLATAGTTTFLEHGVRLLLVDSGVITDGVNTSSLFWQDVSSLTGSIHSEATSGSPTLYYAGSVIGGGVFGLAGYAAGRAAVPVAAAGVAALLGPEVALPALVARMIIGSGAFIGFANGWVKGDVAATVAQQWANDLIGHGPTIPSSVPLGSLPDSDYGDPTLNGGSVSAVSAIQGTSSSSPASLTWHS